VFSKQLSKLTGFATILMDGFLFKSLAFLYIRVFEIQDN